MPAVAVTSIEPSLRSFSSEPDLCTIQTSPDGTAWTTRASETAGANHAYQLYHYDLSLSERVSTLKLRFQFAGNGPTNPASKVSLDDIKIVTTNTATPVNVTMTGPSDGGTFSAQIPAQATGAVVSYSITATDSAAGVTTSATNTYTVAAAAPLLAVTPATTLTSAGTAGSGVFSPASIAYTLTNNGTGSMAWTVKQGFDSSWRTFTLCSGCITRVSWRSARLRPKITRAIPPKNIR